MQLYHVLTVSNQGVPFEYFLEGESSFLVDGDNRAVDLVQMAGKTKNVFLPVMIGHETIDVLCPVLYFLMSCYPAVVGSLR